MKQRSSRSKALAKALKGRFVLAAFLQLLRGLQPRHRQQSLGTASYRLLGARLYPPQTPFEPASERRCFREHFLEVLQESTLRLFRPPPRPLRQALSLPPLHLDERYQRSALVVLVIHLHRMMQTCDLLLEPVTALTHPFAHLGQRLHRQLLPCTRQTARRRRFRLHS